MPETEKNQLAVMDERLNDLEYSIELLIAKMEVMKIRAAQASAKVKKVIAELKGQLKEDRKQENARAG